MKRKKMLKSVILFAALILSATLFAGSAGAMQFQPGELTIDCDVKLKYDVGFRVEDRDADRLGNVNTDDGNRNFDQWDMINNKVTLLADIDTQYKNLGLFVRPKAFYDHVYMTDNADNTTGTNNAVAGGFVSGTDDWADEVEDVHGLDAEMLDLFAYGQFDIGGHNLNVRVGRQVVSWGESLFVAGGIASAQSYVDLVAATDVGKELKEIYLPAEIASFQVNLTDKLGLAGYYQWKWHANKFMEGGTYYSVADFMGDMGAPMIAPDGSPLFTRGSEEDAKDSGQFGVNMTYLIDWNETEFGLYYLNYHDKSPIVTVAPPNYNLSYTEDIKLYGFSFSSMIKDINISGEISYRQDYGFDANTLGDYYTGQASWYYVNDLQPIADKITSIGEAAFVQYVDTPDDQWAWRYYLRIGLDWYQVIHDLDVTCTLVYQDFPNGSTVAGLGYTEGAGAGSIGFKFTYKNDYVLSIAYDARFHNNSTSDRDAIAASFTYTF